jgi:hypothetical protein
METYLSLAQGPLLRLSIALFILGSLRHIGLALLPHVARRLGLTTDVPRRRLLPPAWLVRWKGPADAVHLALLGAVLVGVLAVTLSFHSHVAIFEDAIGVALPALPHGLMHTVTFGAIAAAGVLFGWRWLTPAFRQPLQLRNFFWPPAIGLTLLLGYLTAHPTYSPFGYDVTRLIHLLTAETLLAVAPFAFVNAWAEPDRAPALDAAAAIRTEEQPS